MNSSSRSNISSSSWKSNQHRSTHFLMKLRERYWIKAPQRSRYKRDASSSGESASISRWKRVISRRSNSAGETKHRYTSWNVLTKSGSCTSSFASFSISRSSVPALMMGGPVGGSPVG
eukprot:Lithocolla_globosa_v1_NODE_935_length_3062_cov_11.623545.p3 type:complete len:118 gc:universal NODE_935_length_3062_cov_11.623545:1141-1494(+)